MPVYEYTCECGHEFETHRTLAHHSTTLACPACQQPAHQVFRTAPHIGIDKGALPKILEQRSETDAENKASDYIERVTSGEIFGKGGVYSRKFQEQALAKKGLKLK